MTISDEFGLTDSSSESGEQQQQQQRPNGGRPGMMPPGGAGGGSRPSARQIYEAGLNRQSHRNVNSGTSSNGGNNMRRNPSQRGGGGGGGPSRAASQRARSASAPRGVGGRGGQQQQQQMQRAPSSRRPGPSSRGGASMRQQQNGVGSSRRAGMNSNVEGGPTAATRHPSSTRTGRGTSYRGSGVNGEFAGGADLEAGFHNEGMVVNRVPNAANAMRKSMSRRSSLDRADDPFAEREGKTLTWRNINMTLEAGRNEEKNPAKQLLTDVWGEVPQKEITAIMGPSGAGKTSLLNILAGRARSRGRLTISSDVRLNNYEVDPTKLSVRKQIAFVAQDDSLQVTSTPREAIRFSAKLRLPRSTTDRDLDRLTRRMIQELGLEHCADTMVGGALIKGISGGERKRTSVGVELVTKPALVFLDGKWEGTQLLECECQYNICGLPCFLRSIIF